MRFVPFELAQETHMAALTRILVFIVLISALSFAPARKPNFSGRWQIDRTRSEMTSSDKLRGGSIIQVIEHKEPMLAVTRITRGSNTEDRLDIYLITDGTEKINKAGDQELSFRTRWEASRLVTTIRPLSSASSSFLMETWSLSKDGETLTVELQLLGEKNRNRQKLVYRRTHDG
jgi:hypothetical protein